MAVATFATRVLGLLGVKVLILTNAAGGINTSFAQGALMLISDHINLMGSNPLVGPNDERFGARFPDMTRPTRRACARLAREAAAAIGIRVEEGVYVAVHGPSYETPAEIRAFRTIGADAVGMSTVPEAIVARHMGIEVLGISCITNMAAGVLPRAARARGSDRDDGPRPRPVHRAPHRARHEDLAVPIEESVLVDAARAARRFAVAPFSNFEVGAALETADGVVVTGCNVENATYGLTVCAERVAMFKALSEGHRRFTRVAVVAGTDDPTPPCGACRQILWEFGGDLEVVLANEATVTARHRLAALFPHPFEPPADG